MSFSHPLFYSFFDTEGKFIKTKYLEHFDDCDCGFDMSSQSYRYDRQIYYTALSIYLRNSLYDNFYEEIN